MAKSLGQIHTVNFTDNITSAPGPRTNLDLVGALTEQLNHMVRCGTYTKIVGIDMALATGGTVGGGQLTGHIRYYAPTRGRCEAFKGAFRAMATQMKLQGVSMRDNAQYDFRTPLNDHQDSNNVFRNNATLDGSTRLCLNNTADAGASVFGVHNESVQPTSADTPAADLFDSGFDTLLQAAAGGTDFVINDEAIYSGNPMFAETEYEEIPFMMTWTPDTTDLVTNFQWRPDPALYLAVLCGQMQIYIEEVNFDGGASDIELEIAVHVSGWKSIMGDPDKKRRKSRRSKKSRGRKK